MRDEYIFRNPRSAQHDKNICKITPRHLQSRMDQSYPWLAFSIESAGNLQNHSIDSLYAEFIDFIAILWALQDRLNGFYSFIYIYINGIKMESVGNNLSNCSLLFYLTTCSIFLEITYLLVFFLGFIYKESL